MRLKTKYGQRLADLLPQNYLKCLFDLGDNHQINLLHEAVIYYQE